MDEPAFKWTRLGAGLDGPLVSYQHRHTEIARLIDRLNGTWFARLDMHLSDTNVTRDCSSFEAGKRGIELWAERHRERIMREVEERHQAWLARQTWR